jgi:hypothetical protein
VAFGISGRVMAFTLSGSPADVFRSDDVALGHSAQMPT